MNRASVAGRSGWWVLAACCLVVGLVGCADEEYDARCLAVGRTGYDPETLVCVFEEPECGEGRPVGKTWAACSGCYQYAEDTCASEAGCRVVRAANCLAGDVARCTESSFAACYPTDREPTSSIDCFAAADGLTCSRNAACAAWHDLGPGWESARALVRPSTPQQPYPFVTCAPAGVDPGGCTGVVTCAAAPPACDAGFVPGIANGCYTGACLVESFCASRAPA